jgi:acetylornithine deacetylase/succinyl-diaminopimelate desuccinylase-like protein
VLGERSSLEIEYYVSIPPEFPCKEFMEKLSIMAKEIAKNAGCEATVSKVYEEEPFREDAQSLIVRATSSAFQKLTGFEPVFEWLPYPVSAKELASSKFARDVLALGSGDWTMSTANDEKTTIANAIRASEVLAEIPYEIASLEE